MKKIKKFILSCNEVSFIENFYLLNKDEKFFKEIVCRKIKFLKKRLSDFWESEEIKIETSTVQYGGFDPTAGTLIKICKKGANAEIREFQGVWIFEGEMGKILERMNSKIKGYLNRRDIDLSSQSKDKMSREFWSSLLQVEIPDNSVCPSEILDLFNVLEEYDSEGNYIEKDGHFWGYM
jgi:hypothetical protein